MTQPFGPVLDDNDLARTFFGELDCQEAAPARDVVAALEPSGEGIGEERPSERERDLTITFARNGHEVLPVATIDPFRGTYSAVYQTSRPTGGPQSSSPGL